MDRVFIHVCFGKHESIEALEVPDGFGDEVCGAIDDIFNDWEIESERIFFKKNNGELVPVLVYCEMEHDKSKWIESRYKAVSINLDNKCE